MGEEGKDPYQHVNKMFDGIGKYSTAAKSLPNQCDRGMVGALHSTNSAFDHQGGKPHLKTCILERPSVLSLAASLWPSYSQLAGWTL